MDDIAAQGYAASENSAVYPAEPERLADALAARGLELSGAYKWVNFAYPQGWRQEVAAAKRHVDFCALAGARVANLAEASHSVWDARGPVEHTEPFSAAQWRRIAKGFDEVGAYAQQRGVTLAVHPHGGTAIETPEQIFRLFELTDPDLVGYCLDTGHVVYGGGDPADLARQLAQRVVYVHLKDYRGTVLSTLRGAADGRGPAASAVRAPPRADPAVGLTDLGVSFEAAVRAHLFCPPGQGQLDFVPVLRALTRAGYDGWYVVEAEQDPSLHSPFEAGRQAHEYMTGALDAAITASGPGARQEGTR